MFCLKVYSDIKEILEKGEELDGKEVAIRGWIYRKRSSGSIVFLVIRDGTSIIQAVVKKADDRSFEEASEAAIESSVELKGTLRKDERAINGYEISTSSFSVIGRSEEFPIKGGEGEEFLLDNRHLWLRSRKMASMLRIRSGVLDEIRRYLSGEKCVEVQAPTFVSGACEGGATLFKVPYFDKVAFLTQSAQLYLEVMIYSLNRVYTIAPSFRAERSRTRRHLTEYWHAEAELAWFDNSKMMDFEERMICQIVDRTEEAEEYEVLGKRPREVNPPFQRMDYEEAIEIADLEWGEDLDYRAERAITQKMEDPLFVYNYPKKAKAFYHRPNPDKPEVVLCHDLLAPDGYGEIIGGGERIHSLDVMLKRIEEEGLNPDDYYWYIDLRRYGSIPHAGFGMGVDRLVNWLVGGKHIRDVVPFPRMVRRLNP
jgi:asparaginyl-tRNA synthetase